MGSIQAHELGILGLELRKSDILGAGLGVFAENKFGPPDTICNYYGTLLYENISVVSSNSTVVCGEGMIAEIASELLTSALNLDHKTAGGRTAWIYPAPFCTMRMINDARYMEDEVHRPTEVELKVSPDNYRMKKEMLVDISKSTNDMVKYKDYAFIGLVATKKVKKGEQI